MEILNYIVENRLILVPVLYIIGEFIKRTEYIKDKFIPFMLLVFSIGLSIAMGENSIINNVIQGILVAGVTVLGNQLVKQSTREE